ncbi:androgen-induced gene 1 protein [Manduca sexta]|uniref:androgen-induced gene 1 protein n=1 Tax=Manduca sexta TaxID=7130 RepID=UPI0011831A1C|nr:androgen-induced gene 1 protein [Manduca sexta]
MLSVAFHASVVLFDIYTLWYDQKYVELPLPEEFQELPLKARAIFLTFWCLVLQTIYFSIALLNDVIGTNAPAPKKAPLIRKVKDVLFSLAFPVALYVSSVFWSIYGIHKDLIFPDDIERLFPQWINHAMHTLIVPFIMIELLFTRRNYPTRNVGITVALIFNLMYVVWIHYLYFNKGAWAYPFLEVFNWPMRIIFCTFSTFMLLTVYTIGEKINYFVSPSTTAVYSNGISKRH